MTGSPRPPAPDPDAPLTALVTGGAGFIGSAVVRDLLASTAWKVVVLDALTYAGHRASLAEVEESPRFAFERADVADGAAVRAAFERHRPRVVMHLAAESHVDRSIDGPSAFVRTNLVGTFEMLDAARRLRDALPEEERASFRFLHVSTDEVYGSLGPEGLFTESTPYDPRSPYSASKAGSDHLARAWFHTYGLPVVTTNCSNNYGPRQHPEKLIPTVIRTALAGEPIPVYGRGENVRDWLHVEDHARALRLAVLRGRPGRTYNVGTNEERTTLQMVEAVCDALDRLRPRGPSARPYRELASFVTDRPGHDFRYAIDASRIREELGWAPERRFDEAIPATVRWYLENPDWVEAVTGGARPVRLGTGGGAGAPAGPPGGGGA